MVDAVSASLDSLRDALRAVEDPLNDGDIVSMDLIDDLRIEDGEAHVRMALNTPFAPAEVTMGKQIREICREVGYEPALRAHVGAEHGFDEEILPSVRNVIAVASGKGGVGKTTVAANLAAGLDDLGASVGVLDADVHGPNVPRVLGIADEEPGVEPTTDSLVPPDADGVKVMSMAYMVHDPDDPAIMRGPMVQKVMTHFLENVTWDELDYLIVDLPPGTGDASLDLLQTLPVAGAIIVTTPQRLALDDARKGLKLFEKHSTPIIGIVENMSTFLCPSCGDEHAIYEGAGAAEICEDFEIPHLGAVPTHPDFGTESHDRAVVKNEESEVRPVMLDLVREAADNLGALNRQRVAYPDAQPEL